MNPNHCQDLRHTPCRDSRMQSGSHSTGRTLLRFLEDIDNRLRVCTDTNAPRVQEALGALSSTQSFSGMGRKVHTYNDELILAGLHRRRGHS